MKSLCIKINNNKILTYLLEELENNCINTVYLSTKSFKYYENIIIHYSGNNLSQFYNYLCDVLLDTIINFYEIYKLKELININYFYFSDFEKQSILNNCKELLNSDYSKREDCNQLIYVELLKYVIENKSIYLDGFVNFRLYKYISLLDEIVDLSVNNFIIEREYNEFINLLKIYINSKEATMDLIHLIYVNNESILVDDNKNIISVDENILNAAYLSDISFSSNDFTLNTLLSILPQKIIIHIIDCEDEFINTLKLIFGSRISICSDCSICNVYKTLSNKCLPKIPK